MPVKEKITSKLPQGHIYIFPLVHMHEYNNSNTITRFYFATFKHSPVTCKAHKAFAQGIKSLKLSYFYPVDA